MAQIIATLTIRQDDAGLVTIEGTGAPCANRVFVYGLLEMAKDLVRDRDAQPRVQGATLSDLPH